MEDISIKEPEPTEAAAEVPDKAKSKGKFQDLRDKAADKLPGIKKKILRKRVLIPVGCAVALLTALVLVPKLTHEEPEDIGYEMVKAERRDIVKTVDGSSVLKANDTYNVTALVTGEILSDTFSEGDIVKKNQLLYKIDSEDAQRSVNSAKNALAKANQALADAVKKRTNTITANNNSKKTTQNAVTKALESVETARRNLSTAQADAAELTIKANYTGTVKEVLVKEGSSVNDGTMLASIYNDAWMKVKIPFNDSEADNIYGGSYAELTVASTGDKLSGTVESVAGASTATEAHAIVRYVTIVTANPGGLKAGEKASAVVNGIACSDLGTFENYEEGYLTSKGSGRLVSLYLSENDYITEGQVIGYIESDNVVNSVKNAQASLKNSQLDLDDAYTKLAQLVVDNDTYALDSSVSAAKLEVDNAKLSLETAQKKLEDYEITAPIDGTIITKNKKAGDKLEQNNNSSSEPMAIIYDMSVLKVQLDVDESEISGVKVGQKVDITADAADGMFMGEVTKVGINGTSENGVTVYPVEITITEYGDLLPGMNVDCVITVESAKNVVAVPAAAIQRGRLVYMKGEKKDEKDRAPEGFYSVEVKTGATDSQYVEIKEGLNEGDEVRGAAKPTGKEAEGTAEQQQPQMQGGMGGPPGGGYGGNRGGYGGGYGGNRGGMGGPPGGGMR